MNKKKKNEITIRSSVEYLTEATIRNFRIVQKEGERDEETVIRNFRITTNDGKIYDMKVILTGLYCQRR